MKVKDMTRKERHEALIQAMTKFRVGDIVKINPQCGKHVMADVPVVVEKVSMDHFHGNEYEHPKECYVEEKLEYHLVLNPKPDGSATLRSREHSVCGVARALIMVWPKEVMARAEKYTFYCGECGKKVGSDLKCSPCNGHPGYFSSTTFFRYCKRYEHKQCWHCRRTWYGRVFEVVEEGMQPRYRRLCDECSETPHHTTLYGVEREMAECEEGRVVYED
jgi:hypothetical protein